MNFEHITSWECRVTKVNDGIGTFNYVILSPSADPAELATEGALRLASVPGEQLNLVHVGAKFLCIIGMLCGESNTLPVSMLYFARSDAVGPILQNVE